jgi:hypothetical protein
MNAIYNILRKLLINTADNPYEHIISYYEDHKKVEDLVNDKYMNLQTFVGHFEFEWDKKIYNFYTSIRDDIPIYIDDNLLNWLGYTGSFSQKKSTIKKLADSHNITIIKLSTADYLKLYGMYHSENIDLNEIDEDVTTDSHLVIMPEDFRYLVMQSRTDTGKSVRRYYLYLERIIKLYFKYTELYLKQQENKLRAENDLYKEHTNILGKDNCTLINTRDYLQNKNEQLEMRLIKYEEHNSKLVNKINKYTKELVVLREKNNTAPIPKENLPAKYIFILLYLPEHAPHYYQCLYDKIETVNNKLSKSGAEVAMKYLSSEKLDIVEAILEGLNDSIVSKGKRTIRFGPKKDNPLDHIRLVDTIRAICIKYDMVAE